MGKSKKRSIDNEAKPTESEDKEEADETKPKTKKMRVVSVNESTEQLEEDLKSDVKETMVTSEKRSKKKKAGAIESAQNGELDEIMQEGNEPEQVVKEIHFSAKEFRQQIKGDLKSEALQHFLAACENVEAKQKCIHDYLASGGSCMELLQLLEETIGVTQVHILQLANILLLTIMSKYPNLQTGSFEACRYFLSTHITTINKMLGLSSSGKERRAMLKFLTVLVTFSAKLAKGILLHVNFHSGNLEVLTKNINELDSVRKNFTQFLMAFLVDGHFPTISLLLEKRGLVPSIINGLQFDLADTVCLVLVTLKKNVLEHPQVSKSLKMKIFSTPVVQGIVRLYNWKGPRGYNHAKKVKFDSKDVDQYEKSKVSECVHDFLLVLCTSKHGIIFRDKTLGLGKNHNSLMYTVLESLERPWEHSYGGVLVTKICGTCPDLAKTMWANVKVYLEPRPTVQWLNAVKFLKALLQELRPEAIEFYVGEFSPQMFAQVVQFLVAPTPIIKTLLPEIMIEDSFMKHEIYTALSEILKSIAAYMTKSKDWFPSEFNRVARNLIQDHIARHFPQAQKLLTSSLIEPSGDLPAGFKEHTKLEYLEVVFEIFESYEKLCPQLLESLLLDINVIDIFQQIKICGDDDVSKTIALQMRAARLFLIYNPHVFDPKTDEFQAVFTPAMQHYYQTQDEITKSVLKTILTNSGIFESCEVEIDCWIDSVLELKEFNTSVVEYLVPVLQMAVKNVSVYHTEIAEMKSELSDVKDDDNVNEILEMLEADVMVFSESSRMKQVYFGPMILATLEQLKTEKAPKKFSKYFTNVLVSIFHLQTEPGLFIKVIQKYSDCLSVDVVEYINSWLDEPVYNLKTRCQGFANGLLEGEFTCDFNGDNNLKLQFLRMVVFYVANLDDGLTEKRYTVLVEAVRNLVGDHYDVVLTHPTLLKKFSPLNISKKDHKHYFSTLFLVEVVKILNKNNNSTLLKPFRSKLFNCTMKVLKKSKHKSIENLPWILEVFGLDYNECIEILTQFSIIQTESVKEKTFYSILVYTINTLSGICLNNYSLQPLESMVLEKLSQHLSELNLAQIDTSTLSNSFITYLTRFPHLYKSIPVDLFEGICKKTEFCKESAVLAESLLENRPEFLDVFEQHLKDISFKKGLFLPLINAAVKIASPEEFLKKAYDSFEPNIVKALQKPQKAGQHFEKHPHGVCYLLKEFISLKTAQPYIDKLQKFEISEIFHARMLAVIYKKYADSEKRANNSMLTFVHLIVSLLKRKGKGDDDWVKVKGIVDELGAVHEVVVKDMYAYEQLVGNETFKLFCKLCLKFGISGSDLLLGALLKFVQIVKFSDEEATELMEMITSHSEFMNVVLGVESKCKRDVLHIVLIVCKKNPAIMRRDYLPLLLGAYNATLGESDVLILSLLKMFESVPAQTHFYDFKPFLWGTAAINHYSVRTDLQKALWRQPRVGDVLDILQLDTVLNSIKSYPLNSTLHSDHTSNHPSTPTTYNLSFILPLFSQLLVPENNVQTYRFNKSGALALTISALSSNNEEIRKAACHILYRFYYHLESKKAGKDNILWIRFIEAVCKGTAAIENFKLNNFSSIFLARTAITLTRPQDVMYIPLSKYLSARAAPDFTSIPELYTLLNSSEVHYKDHIGFILNVVKDGLRTDEDFDVALRAMTFKLIMEMFTSVVSSDHIKLLILQVVKQACSLGNGAKLLCNSYGLLSWLATIITTQKQPKLLSEVVGILYNITQCKYVDVGMIKALFGLIVDDCLDVKFESDVALLLVKSLISLYESDESFLNECRMRKVVHLTADKVCEYMLDFKCNISCQGDDLDYYVKLLTNNFLRNNK